MPKKLPSVFSNRIRPEVTHNKKVYYSEKENDQILRSSTVETFPTPVERKIETLPKANVTTQDQVELELRRLFKSTNHVFNIPVEITTDQRTYETKIAGRIHNNIITIDNDTIPVSEIRSLKRKDRFD